MLPGMSTFDTALRFILDAEGGYVNDPDDAGGETNYGISKRAYPDLDIASLTRYDAENIYYRDYWLRCQCNELPDQFAIAVFCSAVNHGADRAVRLLQETLQVDIDGVIGQHTIAAARSQNNRYVLGRLLSFRGVFYADLATRKPEQRKFLRGWLRRLFMLQQFILEHTHAN
jgi:lysozyme family protein